MPAPLDPAEVEAFRECATAHVADSMEHLHAAGPTMAARHKPGGTFCGCAVTVRTAPGDNLVVQKALDLARPGDVIVVDGGGYAGQALVGGIMAALARRREVAGFVVDGAVRDLGDLSSSSLPVYSTGVSPRGPSRVGPGEINAPVMVAGMVVRAGDLIVGDADGVIAIPRAHAAKVLAAARALQEKELTLMQAIDRNALDRTWIDAALRAGGCEIEPRCFTAE